MNGATENLMPRPASAAMLLKGTIAAVLIASVVLICVVLPAEYGIDPTGIGARIGLTRISGADDVESEGEVATPALAQTSAAEPISVLDAVWKAQTPFRNDEMSLTLAPNEGAEIKAMMQVNQRMMFSWLAEGGSVSFDMHGEALGAGTDEFTSYWKGRGASSGHGSFQAPFAGTHGWYWRNRGSAPVTINVRTSGYYERLFRP